MSTTTAGAPPATATDPKLPVNWADIKKRVLGDGTTPEDEKAAKKAKEAKDAKDATDRKAADELAAKKKKDDEAAAAAKAKETPAERVRKVKEGPPLPEPAPEGRSVEQIVRDVLPAITKETTLPLPPAPALDPEVQREIDLAAFAERKNPDRYAGLAGKVRTFFAANDELLAAKQKELGGARSPEYREYLESEDYKTWLQGNRPSYQRGDKAKLAEDMVADRARQEARREMEPELEALKRQTLELKHTPAIQAKANRAYGVVLTDPSDAKDPALEGFAKNPQKFAEEHPDEARLIANRATEAVELVKEIYRVDLNLVTINPAAPSAQHAELRRFSVGLNEKLRTKHPNGVELEDGKILVDFDTYSRRGLQRDPRYRTFTADDLAGALTATRAAELRAELAKRREGVAKSIYAPKPAAGAPAASGQPPTPPDDEPASPTASTSRAPGGVQTPPKDAWAEVRKKYLNG